MTHPRISLICLFWFITPSRFNSMCPSDRKTSPLSRANKTQGGGRVQVGCIDDRLTIDDKEIGRIKRRTLVDPGFFLSIYFFWEREREEMEEIGWTEDRTKLIRHFIFLSTSFLPSFSVRIFWIFRRLKFFPRSNYFDYFFFSHRIFINVSRVISSISSSAIKFAPVERCIGPLFISKLASR